MSILVFVLRIYVLVLWGRFIVDWVRVLAPQFRPKGAVLFLFEAIYTVTDPPLRAVRRVLPPLRLGQIALDLGLIVLLFGCSIAISILSGFLRAL